MKSPMLCKVERKIVGICVLLSLGTVLSALVYYGFKDWMVTGFLGIAIMVYTMFSESEELEL